MIYLSHISDRKKKCKYAKSKERREMPTAPFQKIAEACKTTGLSQYFLRQGCRNGTIPHIKSGGVYYINVPALMKTLDAEQTGRSGP